MSALGSVVRAGANDAPMLRAAVFMSPGQALGGVRQDHTYILGSLAEAGLQPQLIDLADLQQAGEGAWLLRNAATGVVEPWTPPHAALMYHGAIAPAGANPLLAALEAQGTALVTGPNAWNVLTDKLRFATEMGAKGVRVIPTERVADEAAMRAAMHRFGGAAVFKPAVSTEGDGVFVVTRPDQLAEAIAELQPGTRAIIAQPVIDSRISLGLESEILETVLSRSGLSMDELLQRRIEFRIHTVRHADARVETPAVYARVGGSPEQVVNNVAQGATAYRIEFSQLDPADQEAILHAARSLPRTGDVAGWDLIGTPGARHIIEGNSGPGLPNAAEGFSVPDVVRPYGVILREQAELARTAQA